MKTEVVATATEEQPGINPVDELMAPLEVALKAATRRLPAGSGGALRLHAVVMDADGGLHEGRVVVPVAPEASQEADVAREVAAAMRGRLEGTEVCLDALMLARLVALASAALASGLVPASHGQQESVRLASKLVLVAAGGNA